MKDTNLQANIKKSVLKKMYVLNNMLTLQNVIVNIVTHFR